MEINMQLRVRRLYESLIGHRGQKAKFDDAKNSVNSLMDLFLSLTDDDFTSDTHRSIVHTYLGDLSVIRDGLNDLANVENVEIRGLICELDGEEVE